MLTFQQTRSIVISSVLTAALSSGPVRATGQTASAPAPGAILDPHKIYMMPQPREFKAVAGSLDLRTCTHISCITPIDSKIRAVLDDLATELNARSRANLLVNTQPPAPAERAALVGLFPDGNPAISLPGITAADLADIGPQGYVLHIDEHGVAIAARSLEGLIHGGRTLVQIATDQPELPGLHIRDWPALQYRGAHLDISRGQVPTLATLKRLVDVLAEAKFNILELYIEHVFRFRRHPDIAPPEGLPPQEGRDLFDYAARRGIEVHPMFQVLGHSGHILSKPAYQHLRVGPCEKQPWIMTFDVRKDEAVRFINEMVDELCETFPGKLFNVDITEIDIDGLKASGMTDAQATDMVFNYVLKLRQMVARHGMRLIIAQGPLDSVGHLAGLGSKLQQLPKDVIVGSYYCAGGVYQPAWEKDFPRLRANGLDFFAQAWIDSHIRLMPWTGHAADFSDAEVRRGLAHGAIGSTTTDWGDEGHFHFVGQTWYPFLYHGASAWTGGQVDRAYFDRTFTRLLYGLRDDSVARAIKLAGNINGQKMKVRDANGSVTEQDSYHFWEFFRDPFRDPGIAALADPGEAGWEIVKPADEARGLLLDMKRQVTRNLDNFDQLRFGVACYHAMGRKLVLVGHSRNNDFPKAKLQDLSRSVAGEYKLLRQDFERLWRAEDRENDNFRQMLGWFDQTIVPLEQSAGADGAKR